MHQLILVLHVLIAIAIVGLVLIQHGKGASMGAAFGSGASQTVFGSQGSLPFLLKLTAFLAILFFATSLVLGKMTANELKNAGKVQLPTNHHIPAHR
ncbi:MAG: preprotein translocase subunit SecG [Gammaproteobacteria bacterium]|nr:preprotein translocase subunit SecG [Gammaproteobacteria bacterium]